MENHFDRRERTIYVWMLERSVTDDQLYSLFSKIGPIEKLIFKEYADGTPQHCLIVFRYVDSVLTAMSTLQGAELNGKPISLRPLRESTHAVLMPASTMYPSSTSERTATVTSSDGLSDEHDRSDEHNYDGKKVRSNWDAASSAGSASSGVWNAEGLESATEKLTIDDRRGTTSSRSRTSYSSVSSGGGGAVSPSNHSLSPPPSAQPYKQQQQQHHHYVAPGTAIHGSLRKPWRPSRGPIPAPLLAPGGPRYSNSQQYGNGGGYGSHVNLAGTGQQPHPPSLFSQIIPPSPGCGMPSPSPYHHSASFFGGSSMPSPRPLFPDMYKPAAAAGGGPSNGRPLPPTGVFSPTAAPEEVVWRHNHHQHPPPPPPPLMSPPCTAGGRGWFDYGEYSVPQAYRGSATEQQMMSGGGGGEGAGAAGAAGAPPLSLGGMLPPNSPPIGQCARYFDFSDASATLPRLRPSAHHYGTTGGGGGPSSARPSLPVSPAFYGGYGGPATASFAGPSSAHCAPRAPRSAAPFGTHGAQQYHQPFAWPTFGARY